MRGEQHLNIGMLAQCAAQQLGEQLLVIAAQVFFALNLLFDLRLIARSNAPLINTLQRQFARAMARAFVWRFFYFMVSGRIAYSQVAPASSRSRLAISMATSAASLPLVCMRAIARSEERRVGKEGRS